MAIPIADLTPLIPSAAAANYTVDVSRLGAVADDYVVCFIACSLTSGTISEDSGGATTWSLTTLYVANGNRMVVARAKVAAGPTISNPRFALSAGSGLWQGAIVAVRDADTDNTAVIDGSSTDDPGANVSTRTTAAMTPTNDNSLVFYFVSANTGSGTVATRFLPSDVVGQLIQAHDNNTTFMNIAIGTVQQTTKGATAKTYYSNISSRTGAMVIAFKNKASGQISPHGTAGFTKVAWLGDFGVLHDSTLTWGAPDNGGVTWDGAGNIGTLAVSADAVTAVSSGPIAAPWGSASRIASAVNSAGIWVGRKASFSAAVDMSAKQFYTEWYFENVGVQVGTEGLIFAFKDSSGYWEAFQLALKAALVAGRLYTSVIDLDTVTPYASGGGGSINWADITSITPLYHRAGSNTTARNMNFRNWALLSRTTLVGGGAIRPLTIGYAKNVLNGWGMVGCVEKLGETVLPKCDIQIGDGTFPTHYDASATGVTYEGEFSALSQRAVNIDAGGIEFRIKASASDTIIDAASATTAKLPQGWVIDSASSGSAAYNFVGKVISGMVSPTLLAGETYTSMTFSENGPVQTKGANLTSCTVSATTATASEAAVVVDANGSTLQSCTIDLAGTVAGYHAKLGSAVTGITLNGTTLSGTPGTDKFYSELASGTLTITTDGLGTALVAGDVTFIGGSTAVAVIAAPALNQSVAITGLATTYRLQIFDIEYDLTVSGVTVTPTAGATYTHNGITWTVRAASITAGAGTVTLYGTGTPAASGTLTKASGTGDASITFSAYAVDGTELYIGVPAATSYTWTDSVAAAAPRVIRVRVMEDGPGTADAILMIDSIVGMCGITDGTESVGYLVAAVADDVYNDRGTDGSTITGITIDDTTLRLEIASGTITNYNGTDVLVIDGRDIYAFETYWLGTAAGMRDEARFIEAIDAVNFRCSNFKLLGTSGYPIMIRNCYMVDAATGIFASLVDYSGDPISNAPDHMAAIVVSTSDSAVTGTLAEFIAAVPSAADNAQAVWSKTLPL
jgi:hypothetical protein